MPNSLNPIQNSSTVVIIGGGPAGSSCAIKLRQLSQKMGKNLRVVVYEGKRFEKKSYYNQCLGVLSPPIDKMLEEEPDLAIFLRNIEALKKTLKERSTIVLAADSEPFILLKQMPEIKTSDPNETEK